MILGAADSAVAVDAWAGESMRFTALADDGVDVDESADAPEDSASPSAPASEDARRLEASALADGARLDWVGEGKRLLALALPLMAIQGNIYWMWLYNAAFAGTHIGTTAMAAASLANLAGNLTVMSLIYGIIFALETLSAQAIGSGRLEDVGLLVQRCLICCAVALVPGLALWLGIEHVLLFLGQPAAVSALAARFLRVYAFGIPAMVLFEVSRRFLSCQDIVLAYVPITAVVTWLFHPALLSALLAVGFGFDAVALATSCSMWLLALLTCAYIRVWRPHQPRTWRGLDLRRAFDREGMAAFLRLALPGVAQMSEWWAWEVTCAAVGVLGERALSAHAIAYTLVPLLVMLPIGISIAISVRVGQLIGEGRPRHARLVTAATSSLGLLVVLGYATAVSLAPDRIIAFFASEDASPGVVAATREIWPLVSAFLIFDGAYMILNGAVRALSLQLYASMAVLVALWCLGVPAVLLVAFRTDAGLPGVWRALIPTYALLDALVAAIVLRADWARISADVRARASEADAAGAARELAAVAAAHGTCEMGAAAAGKLRVDGGGGAPGLESAAVRLREPPRAL